MADDNKADNQPTKPSQDSADDAAKKIKNRGRPTKVEQAETARVEAVAEQQAKFLAVIAEMITGALSSGVEGFDQSYSEEIEWAMSQPGADPANPITFALTEQEQGHVGLCIALGLQQTAPEFLQRWGFPIMCIALVAAIGVPRINMASQLSRIRRERAADKKKNEDALQPEPTNGNARSVNRMPKEG